MSSEQSTPAIRLDQVGIRFRRDGREYVALDGVELTVQQGEFLCLLGPSGSGKSTLLHLIAGFERQTAGHITVSGRSVVGPDADRGVIFQSDNALFPWLTVAQNVAYGLKATGKPRSSRQATVNRCLRLVGLDDHAEKFPRELSGGMKQRVQLARILANDPSYLLMDEPFAALDAQTRSFLQRELESLWANSGKTVVFVTHDVTEAIWLGDRIAVLTPGPHARVKSLHHNNLPRPRDRMTEEFIDLYNRLNDELETPSNHGTERANV